MTLEAYLHSLRDQTVAVIGIGVSNQPLLRLLLRAKGMARTAAVTGCTAPAGQPEGLYQIGGRSAALRDGALAFLEDGCWAGSVCTAENGLLQLAEASGLTFAQCLPLFSETPARMLGLAHRKCSLEVGKDADLVLTDGDPMVSDTTVKAVFINGRQVVG